MSYVSDMLAPGERVVYEARPSRLTLLAAIAMATVTLSPGGIARHLSTELALTDKRILGRTGFLRKKTLSLRLNEVESVTVRQGLLGRFLDYGTVTVTGNNDRRVAFKGISLALIFQQEAEEAVEMAVLGRKLSDYTGPL